MRIVWNYRDHLPFWGIAVRYQLRRIRTTHSTWWNEEKPWRVESRGTHKQQNGSKQGIAFSNPSCTLHASKAFITYACIHCCSNSYVWTVKPDRASPSIKHAAFGGGGEVFTVESRSLRFGDTSNWIGILQRKRSADGGLVLWHHWLVRFASSGLLAALSRNEWSP